MRVVLVGVSFVAMSSCNALFPFAPDQVCESHVRAACHFAYACCNATERGTFAAALGVDGFRNESECVDFHLSAGDGECGNSLAVNDAINEKRFTYDDALAQQCLKPELDALNTCDAKSLFDPTKLDDKCAGLGFSTGNFAFGTGHVAPKGKCFQPFECAAAGSACVVKADDASDGKVVLTDVGFCQSPGKVGDDCSADTGTNGLCAPGLLCGVDEKCVAFDLKANGAACQNDGDCQSSFCNHNGAGGNAVCADKIADGGACRKDTDCVSNICASQKCQPKPELVVDACNGIQSDDTAF